MPLNLLLIPTEFEHAFVKERVESLGNKHDTRFALCGFGPVVPAAIATEQIHQHQPHQIILCGIAGAYQGASLETGAAYEFSQLKIDGIGVGQGTDFKTPSQMGWTQFAGDANRSPIGDVIDVNSATSRALLTVCTAASDRAEADDRYHRYAVDAEDMEAFAVAAACQLQSIPLRVVRGISNIAGDRDHAQWKIADALHSAMDIVERIVLEGGANE